MMAFILDPNIIFKTLFPFQPTTAVQSIMVAVDGCASRQLMEGTHVHAQMMWTQMSAMKF